MFLRKTLALHGKVLQESEIKNKAFLFSLFVQSTWKNENDVFISKGCAANFISASGSSGRLLAVWYMVDKFIRVKEVFVLIHLLYMVVYLSVRRSI